DSQLCQGRLALKRVDNPLIFVLRQAMAFEQCRISSHSSSTPHDVEAAPTGVLVVELPVPTTARTRDSNTINPSALPSASSHARSGCGISPTTLRLSLQRPATLAADPFGFDSSVGTPSTLVYLKTT